MTKESSAGKSSSGHGTKAIRKNIHEVKRPASSDTTTTDLDATFDAVKSRDVVLEHPEFPVSMNILADVFKNRFA
jgi:hypothetical protein